jgi:hypothetical protein
MGILPEEKRRTTMSNQNGIPSSKLFLDTIQAYERTAALKAALDLNLFTTIGTSQLTARALATRCETSERGMRIFCDYLVASGFLRKDEHAYALTADSDTFLNRRSPAYLGVVAGFLLSPNYTDSFKDVAAAVRKGGTVLPQEGTLAPEHPIWVDFARSMMPLMALPAQLLVKRIDPDANAALKVLDIAAGHGIFGITLATHNPPASVVALDWPNVLEVATANARAAGISERYRTMFHQTGFGRSEHFPLPPSIFSAIISYKQGL